MASSKDEVNYFTRYSVLVQEFCDGDINLVEASTKLVKLNGDFPDFTFKKTPDDLKKAANISIDEDDYDHDEEYEDSYESSDDEESDD